MERYCVLHTAGIPHQPNIVMDSNGMHGLVSRKTTMLQPIHCASFLTISASIYCLSRWFFLPSSPTRDPFNYFPCSITSRSLRRCHAKGTGPKSIWTNPGTTRTACLQVLPTFRCPTNIPSHFNEGHQLHGVALPVGTLGSRLQHSVWLKANRPKIWNSNKEIQLGIRNLRWDQNSRQVDWCKNPRGRKALCWDCGHIYVQTSDSFLIPSDPT